VIELQTGANDWEGVIQAKRAMIDVADGEKQADIYKEIGRLYLEKLGNWQKSSAAYTSALDLQPKDYPLLHTLLDIYTKYKQWEDSIRIIDRIVEIEKDGKRRSKYNYTAAVLLRDEIKAHDEAIDRFNMVLDDDPSVPQGLPGHRHDGHEVQGLEDPRALVPQDAQAPAAERRRAT
jgi:tetratricopeptide (TPR) repeat protein